MQPVFNAEKHQLIGWYCPKCREFDKAIGREKQLPINTPSKPCRNHNERE